MAGWPWNAIFVPEMRLGIKGGLGLAPGRGRDGVALILMGDWRVPAGHDSQANEDRDAYHGQ